MNKIKFLLFFFGIVYVVIIIKLAYIQLYRQNVFLDYLKTKKIQAERGKIFDRNNQPLVVNQITYLLYAEPKKINDKRELISKIAETLKIEESSIEAKIDETKDWVAIKSGVTKENKEAIQNLHFKELGFEDESRRYYPESSLAAQLLGFVGKNQNNDNVGYFGIEGYYNKDLTGLTGLVKSDRDLLGRPIFSGTQEKLDPENGRDLILTIDKSVQQIIKNKLLDGIEKYEAKEGCVIVMDPKTGEILGLTCLPDFDPDLYYQFSEDYFKNPAISNLYEPGSTFKPLIVAAAINNGSVKTNDIFDEDGPIKIGEYSIKTWNNKYEGKITTTRILEKSSNVGMVKIGQKMGKTQLYQTLQMYELGKNTGIDLQGEIALPLKLEEAWYPIDYATVTFGQGIAVTPIQMIKAFLPLVNGGYLMKPYVVKNITTVERIRQIEPRLIKQIITKKTSDTIKKMLVSTIDNGETKWIKPVGYKIGGKTGTAQIPIKGHYDQTKTIASFIGFAPADDPKFIALILLREPKTSQWGSETAAPIFFRIAKDLIVYYNIAPD